MYGLISRIIGGTLLVLASATVFGAGAGQEGADKEKAASGSMAPGAGSSGNAATSSGASGSDPSKAAEPTGARGTEGKSGATTAQNPNDVVDKPKGMDQPAGSVAPDKNSTTR